MARRFYRETGVGADASGAWRVRLDERWLASPAGADFPLPSRALALAIAAEWAAQEEKIAPASMPLMQLAATAIDRMPDHRQATIGALRAYVETDLLLQRGEAPPALIERQRALWDPVIAWAERRYDIALALGEGIRPARQAAAGLKRIEQAIAAYDDFRLVALDGLARNLGSIFLALAVAEGALDIDRAIAAAQLEEVFQAESWGRDDEAETRRASERADCHLLYRFLTLLGG